MTLASVAYGAELLPPRILIHGGPGVGKTTFCAGAPAPVFILTEDGLGTLQVPHFPISPAQSFADIMTALAALYSEEHAFRTVVVDSVDWLEPLIWAETCRRNRWADIETPGYGKGYVAALAVWRDYIEGLNALRRSRDMTIIQIAHSAIRRFDSPETEPFDRYEVKLHRGAAALLQEHSDAVLFAGYRISTVKADVGFNKKVTRAVGSGERVLYTAERPAFLAKNRFALPDTLPFTWQDFAAAIPHFKQPAEETQ